MRSIRRRVAGRERLVRGLLHGIIVVDPLVPGWVLLVLSLFGPLLGRSLRAVFFFLDLGIHGCYLLGRESAIGVPVRRGRAHFRIVRA